MKTFLPHNLFLVAVFLIMFGFKLHGQVSRFYTSSNSGLENSQINQIYQDRVGFIWVATEDGLSSFDGMKFTTYTHHADDSTSLLTNYVQSMYEDTSHNFWIGTASGLQRYDRIKNCFSNFILRDDMGYILDPYISTIIPYDSNHVLVGTSGHGFYIINLKTFHYTISNTNHLVPASTFIHSLLRESNGDVWVGTENDGAFLFHRNLNVPIENKNAFSLLGHYCQGQQINSFVEDTPHHKVFIGSLNQGIFVYDQASKTLRAALSADAQHCSVKSMFRDSQGRVWIGTNDRGLMLLNPDNEQLMISDTVRENPSNGYWHVSSIMEDSQGNIWAALYEKGIYVIPNFINKFHYEAFSPIKLSQNVSCVLAILVDRNNGLWIGTDGSGLFYKAAGSSKIKNFTKENSRLLSNAITALWQDKNGTIWIGTALDGLFTMNQSQQLMPFPKQNELSGRKITVIKGDSMGNIWIGTYGEGLDCINYQTGKIDIYQNQQGTTKFISNNWINTLLPDREGNMIMGTFQGLNAINIKTRKATYYNYIPELPYNTKVYSLCEDYRGILWVGTNSGLIAFDRKIQKARLYTTHDGLPNNVINAIEEDNQKNLWISTNHGLAKFSLVNGSVASFHAYDGLQSDEFRRGAVWKTPDGQLYFGGINGINSFYPQDINHSRKVPNVYVTDFMVFNKSVNYGDGKNHNVFLSCAIPYADKIILKHSDNVFSIQFDALEFTHPQSITYQYKMEGFDKGWKTTDANNRIVTYTNLSPGTYTFKVKATNTDMEGSESIKTLKIIILPPWWLTWWAKLLYVLIVLASGYAFYLHLQKKIKDKQEHLQQLHEEEIKESKLRFFTNISHEIRTPITLIISPLERMLASEPDSQRKELYNLMYRNALRILRLINQLMDMRKIDNNQMKLHFQETDLVFLIKDIMMSFDFLANNKKIDFQFESKMQSLNAWVDPSNFDKILFNVLSNAFKFTPENGHIKVALTVGHDDNAVSPLANYVEIAVSDSGIGIDPATIDKIYDRFVQGSSQQEQLGSGVGLHLTKQLVELHHGTIFAVNNEVGCTFYIRIPLSSAHLTSDELQPGTKRHEITTPESKTEVAVQSGDDASVTVRNSVRNIPTVVVVDDDKDLLAYLRLELGGSYHVEAFDSSKKAWNVIAGGLPDVVISDVMMTEMNGNELCAKIKTNSNTNHIPVILLSSMTKDDDVITGLDCGADVYLTKPFNIDILKRHINQVILNRDTLKKKFTLPVEIDYNALKVNSADKRLLEKTIQVIKDNMEDAEFGVEKLSTGVGLSRVHLNRKMKELINVSPSDMIRSIRLKQAAYLLINNEINISEVAYKVGFSSHSYFTNSFHDFFGMKPSEFVEKYKDNPDNPVLKEILG
ncbi:hybrid sensor histidine kinase/response regulator transcription factor [Microbacter margulisiae]|uniref:histidine kinase n=1 Tax=Microbacter margulisiae TaxID=1350067 RepID=A0A7W5H349_9PORP|nr:hybrid sensor histidine kinase/response regulator transcription factor [Microbacter margulisiae]MBB3188121.1 signal transduction histidine kinase/ligand-binding sensor domain-containing protein/DNA-binding response OmpR family regulator [Microbacter margulisiae]